MKSNCRKCKRRKKKRAEVYKEEEGGDAEVEVKGKKGGTDS